MNHRLCGRRFLAVVLVVVSCRLLSGCGSDEEQVVADLSVHFADAQLEAVVREALQKLSGSIFPWDLTGLVTLNAEGKNIANLGGIEFCVNLAELDLSKNNISVIRPLRALEKLSILELDDNAIIDLAPLQEISGLKQLRLRRNLVQRIEALAGLQSLTLLTLGNNRINDISPLEGLLNLVSLDLEANEIEDLYPLARNVAAKGLGTGDSVILSGNPLSSLSVELVVPFLKEKGVSVTYP